MSYYKYKSDVMLQYKMQNVTHNINDIAVHQCINIITIYREIKYTSLTRKVERI